MNIRDLSQKFVTILVIVSVFTTTVVSPLFAYETTCPEGMTDQECLQFLQDQANQVRNDANAINGVLSQEQYEQMGLIDKINYLNGQISGKQAKIDEMEIDIETKNVEIRIIAKNINDIQENINTLTQETDQLRDTIGKRLSTSYKYNKMSPLEIVFSADNFDTMLRKTKYLLEARKKDKDQLELLTYNIQTLQSEEQELSNKKADIQTKRNEIEIQKTDIFTQKQALVPQQTELSVLIAESRQREADYKAQLAALSGVQNSIDGQIQAMIMRMFHEGQLGNGTYVAQGQIIGFQGHTGCAFGSHLHFGMVQGNNVWSADVNPFSGYLNGGAWYGAYVSSGSASAPLGGAVVTQGFHLGMYLDLVSTTEGDQSGNYYYVNPGDIACSPGTSGWMSLGGEGAPIYSVLAGTVYYGVDSWGGAKYALVDHGNGLVSMYVHIR
jgi:peptidoglycan hydrolase CwlO-like protein